MAAEPEWLLPDGWSTAHVLKVGVRPHITLCGRRVGDRQLLPLMFDDQCGQCRRRLPAESTSTSDG